MKLPKNFKLGKRNDNGIMVGGRPAYSDSAQIFLNCSEGGEDCHDSIALLPIGSNRNKLIDSLSDKKACEIFHYEGWSIIGYEGSKRTLCPNCQKLIYGR